MKFFAIPGWACTANYFDSIQKNTCFDWSFYNESMSDIDSFLDILQKEKEDLILLAYSLGCLYALENADSLKNCRGLILISPFASFCGEGRQAKLVERQIKLMIKGIEQDPAKTIAQFHLNAGSINIETKSFNQTQLKLGLENLINKKFTGSNTPIPTLLLRGSDDKIVAKEQFNRLKDLLPSAQVHTFQNAPHDLRQEPKLNKIIANFVESLHD